MNPGAPSVDELAEKPTKVGYFQSVYSKMHRNLIGHDYYIDRSNIDQLQGFDFVFLCLDRGSDKQTIVDKLEAFGTPFIDVGMGVELVEGSLRGILRITTSTQQLREHVRSKNRIPFTKNGGDDAYAQNIQVADLNALNAALAVIKWKKLFGFYADLESEHYSAYTIDGNSLINEDQL